VIVGGTDNGNVVIVQLYPSPKIINTLSGSSGTVCMHMIYYVKLEYCDELIKLACH